MTRMHSLILALAVIAASPAEDQAAALAHRQTLPVQAMPYTYYVSTSGVPDAKREQLEIAMNLVMPSLSLKPLVDEQIPLQVTDTLYCIDTRNFGWEHSLPRVLKKYPYGAYGYPSLVIRAEWFVPFATDCAESDAYYQLLFGKRFAKRDDFVKFFEINGDPEYAFGMIEGDSGVGVAKKRWMESRPTPKGKYWFTRDSAKITNDSDPLEHPDGKFKHDAEEHIVLFTKVSAKTGLRGGLQAYWLANGAGVTQDKAPTNIVTDNTRVRHNATEIINGISCIACHTSGLNMPTINEYRRVIKNGVDIYAKKNVQQQLEAFHLSDIGKEFSRHNEDFCAMVEHCTGVTPEEANQCFIDTVKFYEADVTLEQGALELGSTPKELSLALAYASNDGKMPTRLAELAHGEPLPRTLWEEYYVFTYKALKYWRRK